MSFSSGASSRRLNRANSERFYNAHETLKKAANAERNAAARRIQEAWRAKRQRQRQRQIQLQVVTALQARTARYKPKRNLNHVVNLLTSGFTGQPTGEIRAARKGAARQRWHQAVNALHPTRVNLRKSVEHAYHSLDYLAKGGRYKGLTAMIQANLSELLLVQFKKRGQQFMRDHGAPLGTQVSVAQCVTAAGAFKWPLARLAAWLVLRGWDIACARSPGFQNMSKKLNEGLVDAVAGSMKRVWRVIGVPAATVLPSLFQGVVKDTLTKWVHRANPALVPLIDMDSVMTALKKNSTIVGEVLVGQNVSLLPVVLDVASALDPCIVHAILSQFGPEGFGGNNRLPAECRNSNRPARAAAGKGLTAVAQSI